MTVTNLEAYRKRQQERWKKDILLQVEKELDKIHPSNFEIVAEKVIDYAKVMCGVYYRTATEVQAMRQERT